MNKSLAALALSLAVGGGAAWAAEFKGHKHGVGGKSVSMKGELVDMACFMAHDGRGKKHAKCAEQCVLGGAPLGLVTEEGNVYLLVEDHSSAKAKKPYLTAKEMIAQTVTVTGDAHAKGGVQALVVESVAKE